MYIINYLNKAATMQIPDFQWQKKLSFRQFRLNADAGGT